MKIAHLDTGRTWRGGQQQVLLLMRALRERGHTNLLLAPDGPLLEKARAEEFAVVRWNTHGELDPGAILAAVGALRAAAPEVAHAHSAHAHALGVPAARIARVPAVVVSRRVDFRVATHPLSGLKYRMPVDRYLCISHGVMEAMAASGVPRARLALVPSGIDLDEIVRAGAAPAPSLRTLIGAPDDAPVVGTVASLAPHKDHAMLLDAAAAIRKTRPDVHFAWLGEGECRAALEARRAALGLESRVHLLGFRTDARALLPQFTLFALGSYLEGLCTSLLDAQALGVPIVATRVGGVPEVVEDGATGWLSPAREPERFAATVLAALADPAARAARSARARETVRAFSMARTAELSLAAYAAALAEHGVPA